MSLWWKISHFIVKCYIMVNAHAGLDICIIKIKKIKNCIIAFKVKLLWNKEIFHIKCSVRFEFISSRKTIDNRRNARCGIQRSANERIPKSQRICCRLSTVDCRFECKCKRNVIWSNWFFFLTEYERIFVLVFHGRKSHSTNRYSLSIVFIWAKKDTGNSINEIWNLSPHVKKKLTNIFIWLILDGLVSHYGIIYWKSLETKQRIGCHRKSDSCVQLHKIHSFIRMTTI